MLDELGTLIDLIHRLIRVRNKRVSLGLLVLVQQEGRLSHRGLCVVIWVGVEGTHRDLKVGFHHELLLLLW